MKLTPAAAREVRRLTLDVVLLDGEQDAAPSLADMARRAKGLLDGALRERRRPAKRLAPGRTPEERRVEHRDSSAALRVSAFARCEGTCEACRAELGASWELHHVEAGGHRRSRQRMGNVLALCWECHRRAHRGDLGTLAQIVQAPSLDAEGRRAAERRLAKVEEARAQHGRTP